MPAREGVWGLSWGREASPTGLGSAAAAALHEAVGVMQAVLG